MFSLDPPSADAFECSCLVFGSGQHSHILPNKALQGGGNGCQDSWDADLLPALGQAKHEQVPHEGHL